MNIQQVCAYRIKDSVLPIYSVFYTCTPKEKTLCTIVTFLTERAHRFEEPT